MNITYDGTADVKKYTKADLEKAGVEHSGVTFYRGESTEVSDELGAALIAKDGFFFDEPFNEVKSEDPDQLPLDEPEPKGKKNSK